MTDSGASPGSGGEADSSMDVGAIPDGPGDGGACGAPEDTAPTITATCDSHAMQSPTGGPVADGTYYATSVVVIGSAPCSSEWAPGATLQVSSGVLSITYAAAPGIGEDHQQWTFAISGNQLTRSLRCDTDPNGVVGGTETDGYTATGAQLTLFTPSNPATGVLAENVTFTRQ